MKTHIDRVPSINFKILKNSIRHNNFVKNVTTMLAGNISAQAIAFLAAPVITRLYTAEDFGTMTLISSCIGVLSVIACLRYESAIVLPADDEKAQNIFALCLLNSLVITVFLFFIVTVFKDSLVNLMNESRVAEWLWFIPVGVFIYGSWQSLVFWQTRIKKFVLLSISQIVMPIITASCKISAGLIIGSSAFWLITGNILGPLVAAVLLGIVSMKDNIAGLKKSIAKGRENRDVGE